MSPHWRQRNVETGLLPSEVVSLFDNVEYFNGIFVEPVPLQVIDLIRDLKPHDNATVIQAAIAGEIGIQQMGISLNQRTLQTGGIPLRTDILMYLTERFRAKL